MNMYEKIFRRQAGDIAVYMDELTTRRMNIFSQFLDRELEKHGKLSVSVFGKNEEELLTVRLEKGNPYTFFNIGDTKGLWWKDKGVLGVVRRGPPFTDVPYTQYTIPYDRVKYILVSTWVPKEELNVTSKYFVRADHTTANTYIYEYKQSDT